MSIQAEKSISDIVVNTILRELVTTGYVIHKRTRYFTEPDEEMFGKIRKFEKLDSFYLKDYTKKIALDFARQYAHKYGLEVIDNTF